MSPAAVRLYADALRALVRPPFAVLLAMFMGLGLLQGTPRPGTVTQVLTCVAVAGWMLCSVALNDLADVEIDRVNLRGHSERILAVGTIGRRDLLVLAGVSAGAALAAGAALGAFPLLVLTAGLALAAAYSLPPFRLGSRGMLTSLLLPLGYVAVPFLLGASPWAPRLPGRSLLLLAGLYVGFIGRLALKDFRDQLGDRMYGKRTLLVRHGRRATCAFSAVNMTLGSVLTVAGLPRPTAWLVAAAAVDVVAGLVLLWVIARDTHGMADRANVAALAMVGRWFVMLALAQTWAVDVGWPTGPLSALAGLTTVAGLALAVRIRHLLAPTDSGTPGELEHLPRPTAAAPATAGRWT